MDPRWRVSSSHLVTHHLLAKSYTYLSNTQFPKCHPDYGQNPPFRCSCSPLGGRVDAECVKSAAHLAGVSLARVGTVRLVEGAIHVVAVAAPALSRSEGGTPRPSTWVGTTTSTGGTGGSSSVTRLVASEIYIHSGASTFAAVGATTISLHSLTRARARKSLATPTHHKYLIVCRCFELGIVYRRILSRDKERASSLADATIAIHCRLGFGSGSIAIILNVSGGTRQGTRAIKQTFKTGYI